MSESNRIADPASVYRQTADKQRLVITGGESKMIGAIVIYILNWCHRQFDYVTQFPADGEPSHNRISDAPLIIIQENPTPDSSILNYHHHIAVISDVSPQDAPIVLQFADATPKGGVVIYSETEPAQSIGKKERPGTTSVGYNTNLHVIENGRVILISSHGDRFPIRVTGANNLRSISAAKEILKKIGITSEQFYHAITGFEG